MVSDVCKQDPADKSLSTGQTNGSKTVDQVVNI